MTLISGPEDLCLAGDLDTKGPGTIHSTEADLPPSRGGSPADGAAAAMAAARDHLLGLQDPKGWWKGDLETNVTMDCEDLLLREFLGIRTDEGTAATAKWIRSQQREDGTWATFFGGPGDLNTTIESYVALRLAGDTPDAPHMAKAGAFVIGAGGIECSRVFTRLWLALFGLWSWDALPALPPEVIFFPSWVPLNVYDFACWARQTVVALTVVATHRPAHRLNFDVDELLTGEPAPPKPGITTVAGRFWALDSVLHAYERHRPTWVRHLALRVAERWIVRRQEADGSWGGIQPPWVYSLIALYLQGYPINHPVMAAGLAGLESFTLDDERGRRLEACQSPIWDTALGIVALSDAGLAPDDPALRRAAEWLVGQEVRCPGDWAIRRPQLPPGGWAFEFENDVYPDVDDTAEVVLALRRVSGVVGAAEAIDRAVRWAEGMQSAGGGWAAFDADNTRQVLTKLPFCDFGEVIDPPSSDVTAHIIEMLVAEGGHDPDRLARGLAWLRAEQETDGAWFGRWGVNYIYGIASAVPTLVAAGVPRDDPGIRHAVTWLAAHQHESGGWGEDLRSYDDPKTWAGRGEPTASQTAWALIALLAAGERGEVAQRGVAWLVEHQRADGTWDEPWYTGTGFPWDFSINYHLYRLIFPVMALGRWVNGDPSDRHVGAIVQPVAAPSGPLSILTPLGIEAGAVRRGAPTAKVSVSGMGSKRSLAFLGQMSPVEPDPVARPIPPVVVMGLCGALQPGMSAGDLVVATEVRGPGGTVTALAGADGVADVLRCAGHVVHLGPIVSASRAVRGPRRPVLGRSGALAVDMESAWLAEGLAGSPGSAVAVVRVVVDTPAAGLVSLATVPAGIRALRALSRAAEALSEARSGIPVAPHVSSKEVK